MALILVIEDDADLRAELAAELRLEGYDVIEAGDGEQGLAAYREHRPDLVLCDINLPSVSGKEVLTALRHRDDTAALSPFIYLTGQSSREDVIAGKRAGADDYVVKPVDFDLLLATIEARLAQVARLNAHHEAALRQRLAEAAAAAPARTLAEDVLDELNVGIVILGPGTGIAFANPVAQAIVDARDGLMLVHGRLRASTVADSRALDALVAGLAAAGPAAQVMAVQRPSQAPAYHLVGRRIRGPGRDEVALFITEAGARPMLAPEIAVKLLGITAGEAQVLAAMVAGETIEDVARSRHVSRNAVAQHVKSLFAKTGTGRQSDLIGLVLAASPTLLRGLAPRAPRSGE